MNFINGDIVRPKTKCYWTRGIILNNNVANSNILEIKTTVGKILHIDKDKVELVWRKYEKYDKTVLGKRINF